MVRWFLLIRVGLFQPTEFSKIRKTEKTPGGLGLNIAKRCAGRKQGPYIPIINQRSPLLGSHKDPDWSFFEKLFNVWAHHLHQKPFCKIVLSMVWVVYVPTGYSPKPLYKTGNWEALQTHGRTRPARSPKTDLSGKNPWKNTFVFKNLLKWQKPMEKQQSLCSKTFLSGKKKTFFVHQLRPPLPAMAPNPPACDTKVFLQAKRLPGTERRNPPPLAFPRKSFTVKTLQVTKAVFFRRAFKASFLVIDSIQE